MQVQNIQHYKNELPESRQKAERRHGPITVARTGPKSGSSGEDRNWPGKEGGKLKTSLAAHYSGERGPRATPLAMAQKNGRPPVPS